MNILGFSAPCDPDRLPLTAVEHDWFGEALVPPVRFAFAVDPTHLHFLATHDAPASAHPHSAPGKFQAELWKFDVAEFFLSDPASGRYLEFNLAPDGGWWSCLFTAPLARLHAEDDPIPGVRTAARQTDPGWQASASLPVAWLQDHVGFGPSSHLNATFILESPAQRFLTASPLGSGEPAFHRPDRFPKVALLPHDTDSRGCSI